MSPFTREQAFASFLLASGDPNSVMNILLMQREEPELIKELVEWVIASGSCTHVHEHAKEMMKQLRGALEHAVPDTDSALPENAGSLAVDEVMRSLKLKDEDG